MERHHLNQRPFPLALTFDDVLLLPAYSEVLPTHVDTGTNLSGLKLSAPFLSAAMDTVTEELMAIKMAELGGLGIIHKNQSIETQIEQVKKTKSKKAADALSTQDPNGFLAVGAATGVGKPGLDRALALIDAGVDLLVIDTAHGHSKGVMDQVREIRQARPLARICAGNVGTKEGCEALIEAGADIVKVGIGPGAICTTRVVSGVGMPQLYALFLCREACEKAGKAMISDGGITASGDITKAIAAGASAVMMGSMLAGTDESPGETFFRGGKRLKIYRGMGSLGAMEKGSKDRYGQHGITDAKKLVPEGVEASVPYKGPVEDVIIQLGGGLRSGMGYLGASTLTDLRERARFVQITSASLAENHPHGLFEIEQAPNYPGSGPGRMS